MNAQQEQRIGELVAHISEMADVLPGWTDAPPEAELQIFESLRDAADDLWALWREMQIEKDLAA